MAIPLFNETHGQIHIFLKSFHSIQSNKKKTLIYKGLLRSKRNRNNNKYTGFKQTEDDDIAFRFLEKLVDRQARNQK